MVNNFTKIEQLLTFNTDDDFYHLQILKRKKDGNSEMTSNNVSIATFIIKSREHLLKIKNDVINICDATNARAYINLNKKSHKRCSLEMLSALASNISNEHYLGSHAMFHSMTGKFNSPSNKKNWLIDIDDMEWFDKYKEMLFESLYNIMPIGNKVIEMIPTKNGVHIITRPFNLHSFNTLNLFGDIDVHKNNPTVLYCK